MHDRSGLWDGDKHLPHVTVGRQNFEAIWVSETYFQLPQWFDSLYYKSTSMCLQKDKPAFQTQLVESYHIKKNLVQSVQETQTSDFCSQTI